MPIRPDMKPLYPADWKAVSLARRQAAGWRCECHGECAAEPHPADAGGRCLAVQGFPHPVTRSTVVLTVAHLDRDPANNDPGNHAAMCQRCHLSYDIDQHRTNRVAGEVARATAGMDPLW